MVEIRIFTRCHEIDNKKKKRFFKKRSRAKQSWRKLQNDLCDNKFQLQFLFVLLFVTDSYRTKCTETSTHLLSVHLIFSSWQLRKHEGERKIKIRDQTWPREQSLISQIDNAHLAKRWEFLSVELLVDILLEDSLNWFVDTWQERAITAESFDNKLISNWVLNVLRKLLDWLILILSLVVLSHFSQEK